MNRTDPPRLATWMLEHLTSCDRDEALAGDLLEEYCGGRSDGWYWRQVVAACVVSWLRSLRARMPLLAFALLWSMLAPAWKVLCDGILDSQIVNYAWELAGGMWILPAFVLWAVLHSTFLWAGMLIYLLFHARFGKTFRRNQVSRAFLLAPLIFSPIYSVTFVLVNLYWYSVFANAKLAAAPLGQIADLRMLSDVMRIPYFIALLSALWGAIPRATRASQLQFAEAAPIESSTRSDTLAIASTLDPFTLRRFFGLMVAAGLINAMIVGFLLCRLPGSNAPSLSSLTIRAMLYVTAGAAAGILGAWLYWSNPASPFRENPPLPFALFALICAAGWVWVPSIVIFSEQVSAASSISTVIAAFVLASGLRRATYLVLAPASHAPSNYTRDDVELFSESLYHAPWRPDGYIIAICLYAGGWAVLTHSNYTACALFALSVFAFAWKGTIPLRSSLDVQRENREAALRLALVVIPAVLVTIWALLDGVAHRNRVADMNAALSGTNGASINQHTRQKAKPQSSAYGLRGYESLILWPPLEKKQMIAPLPVQESFLVPGTTRPLIIPFDGPYWYVQPPDEAPGPTAHQAHGTPLSAEIESINFIPLVMEAHQILGKALPVARCRELQVEIENRDNGIGAIAMAVLLSDAASPGKQALYLGQQPIVSTEPTHFFFKSSPVFETLRFSIPAGAKIRRFNEITVMMLPDVEHALTGPKIAIRQFQLFPR